MWGKKFDPHITEMGETAGTHWHMATELGTPVSSVTDVSSCHPSLIFHNVQWEPRTIIIRRDQWQFSQDIYASEMTIKILQWIIYVKALIVFKSWRNNDQSSLHPLWMLVLQVWVSEHCCINVHANHKRHE